MTKQERYVRQAFSSIKGYKEYEKKDVSSYFHYIVIPTYNRRRYHNVGHLYQMLVLAEGCNDIMKAAIILHDFVYLPYSNVSEEISAVYAYKVFRKFLPEDD